MVFIKDLRIVTIFMFHVWAFVITPLMMMGILLCHGLAISIRVLGGLVVVLVSSIFLNKSCLGFMDENFVMGQIQGL